MILFRGTVTDVALDTIFTPKLKQNKKENAKFGRMNPNKLFYLYTHYCVSGQRFSLTVMSKL